jgi:hypothetical protein
MRINLSSYSSGQPKAIGVLVRQFAEAHSIKNIGLTKDYVATPSGARAFHRWLKSEGFLCEYWCLEPLVVVDPDNYNPPRKTIKYLAFGITIQDDCPRFVELKLRYG